MIYYFSGTGNSRYVSGLLASAAETELTSITDKNALDSLSASIAQTDKDLIFVFPVYSWGVPPIMVRFAETAASRLAAISRLQGGQGAQSASERRIWCIATCGDETGLAVEQFCSIFSRHGLKVSGAWSVICPNVYVLLPGFGIDSAEVEEAKINAIGERVEQISRAIRNSDGTQEMLGDVHKGRLAWLKSKIIYPLFVWKGITPSRWRWSKECVSCGRCAAVCPVHNIEMEGSHPRWGHNCTSCLACYHACPRNAVEYGRMTTGKGQYRRFLK